MLLSSPISWSSRGEAKMTEDEYVARGKKANADQMSANGESELFDALREEECLDDVLEVPFALQHIKDVHAAMQLAVARVGEEREDLTKHRLFCAIFSAFVLGFAIGLVQAHRAQHTGHRLIGRNQKPKDTTHLEAWGIEVALYYLVWVERCGIIEKAIDEAAYGIQQGWRQIADERRLAEVNGLDRCVEAGKQAATTWTADDEADLGILLAEVAERTLSDQPNPAGQQAASA